MQADIDCSSGKRLGPVLACLLISGQQVCIDCFAGAIPRPLRHPHSPFASGVSRRPPPHPHIFCRPAGFLIYRLLRRASSLAPHLSRPCTWMSKSTRSSGLPSGAKSWWAVCAGPASLHTLYEKEVYNWKANLLAVVCSFF